MTSFSSSPFIVGLPFILYFFFGPTHYYIGSRQRVWSSSSSRLPSARPRGTEGESRWSLVSLYDLVKSRGFDLRLLVRIYSGRVSCSPDSTNLCCSAWVPKFHSDYPRCRSLRIIELCNKTLKISSRRLKDFGRSPIGSVQYVT